MANQTLKLRSTVRTFVLPIALLIAATMLPRTLWAQDTASMAVDLDTVKAGRFDNGKMWTFDDPPIQYFTETYDFAPDEAWFEKARLGALRIPGCTASFVSPNGLIMTNHHCGRGFATSVSRPGENILEDGFYAPSLDEERPVQGFRADQLIAIEDVTDEVDAAMASAQTPAERAQARQDAIQQIQSRIADAAGGQDAGMVVQVISLYNGGKYAAYTFHRFTDARLVFIPERRLGFYGGDWDNFTYPRYALDVSFFRLYENGEPLHSDHYFPFSDEGSHDGEPVFVVGNPGATSRLLTIAQFEYLRDVQEPEIFHLVDSRVQALDAYRAAYPDMADDPGILNLMAGWKNTQKLYKGRVKGLRDPVILARRKDTQRQFREALAADPALQEQYGGLFDEMATIQQQKREQADAFGAFLSLGPNSGFGSAVLRRAMVAQQLLSMRADSADEGTLDRLEGQLTRIQDQPPDLQERMVVARLEDFERYFGEPGGLAEQILQSRKPEEAADDIVSTSPLATQEGTQQALDAGTLRMDDPAIAVAAAIMPAFRDYQSAAAGLGEQENEIGAKLGRARYDVYGTQIPPDATFSLRIADGVVAGYPYNGTEAPPYTTYYGLYDHYYSYPGKDDWDLPQRWLDPPSTFDLSTPVDLVATNDIIGGNSGSPLLNRDLEVVGLVFDGNIESLAGAFIYLTDTPRTVAVDSRGIVEALDEIYDADRIVLELKEGRLVSTEAEADQQMGGSN